jgi:8-oxo-dGTP diphosphatase
MQQDNSSLIRIAAAFIDDGAGRLLLVRKAGTRWFMQAGGKIGDGEQVLHALQRELMEEIGLDLPSEDFKYLGRFLAPAANEPQHHVEAEVFHARVRHRLTAQSEIEQTIWVTPEEALMMPLAPLTRNHILPLAKTLLQVR